MQHTKTESGKHDGQYCHLLKLEKIREARVLKHAIQTNFDSFSLSKTGNMRPKLNLTNDIWIKEENSVLSVEPLHLLLLGISKSLKECMKVYLKIGERHMYPLGSKREGKKR